MSDWRLLMLFFTK